MISSVRETGDMVDHHRIPRLTPRLVVDDVDAAIGFCAAAFGADLVERIEHDDVIVHAEVRIGDEAFSLTEGDGTHNVSPTQLGGSAMVLTLVVDDADATGATIVAAGAEVVYPIDDQSYGQREGRLRDPSGHLWIISQAAVRDGDAAEGPRAFHSTFSDDLARTRDWYLELFDYEVVFDSDWFVQLQRTGSPQLEIGIIARDHEIVPEPFRHAPAGGMLTIVVDDADAIHTCALAAGVDIVEAPRNLFYGQRRLVLRDPDGALVDVSSACDPDPAWLATLS